MFASILDRFWFRFGADLASQMVPQGHAWTSRIGPWAVQDGPKIVLVRSFFRLAVWDRFFDPLKLLLGSFWRALGGRLRPLGVI